MKKVLTVIIIMSIVLTSVFAGNLKGGKWGVALNELDVKFNPFAAFVEGGVAFRGFKFIPENTTKLQLMIGFPIRQIPSFWREVFPMDNIKPTATELSGNIQLHQGFFRDFLDVYVGADFRYNSFTIDGLAKKVFTPSIIGGAKLDGEIDNKVDLIGWTLNADITSAPTKNFALNVNGTAGFTPVQILNDEGKNSFSIVVKDRITFLTNRLWFNANDPYATIGTVYNLKIQKIFRGFNRGSALANGALIANQIDVRLAGPEFHMFKSKNTCFPRVNLFLDFGAVFNKGTLADVKYMNKTLYPSNMFVMSAGFQAGLNLFGFCDLMYQGAFPIIKTADVNKTLSSTILLGLTF